MAALVGRRSAAEEGVPGSTEEYGHTNWCIAGDDKGQGHVNLLIDLGADGTGEQADGVNSTDRGDGHIDFSASGTEDACGDNKGDGHIDFSVDPSGGYAINVELLGGAGLLLCAGSGADSDALRVVLQADGLLQVNGVKLAACDPDLGTRITVAWGAGAAAVSALAADGALRTGQYTLDFAPETVRVEATDASSLSLVRQ
jgi:hypothetical protein